MMISISLVLVLGAAVVFAWRHTVLAVPWWALRHQERRHAHAIDPAPKGGEGACRLTPSSK